MHRFKMKILESGWVSFKTLKSSPQGLANRDLGNGGGSGIVGEAGSNCLKRQE